jgi:hypothetical protein
MKIWCLLCSLCFLTSCVEHFTAEEVCGAYAPVGYVHSFDTLRLRPNGTYERSIYNHNRQRRLHTQGTWRLEEKHRLVFEHFYVNLDRDLLSDISESADEYMFINTYFERQHRAIQFCVGYYEGQNCYRKVQ